ncbi:MAG TPA: phage tail protein [Acidimicrobiales bacterium]|nr:phage tail protein [Acidimicrobiales bacterium]
MPDKPFSVNADRFEPYSTWRFLVYFDKSTTPVAGVSKVTGLKRSSQAIEYKEGGATLTRKGLGRTTYDPITLERGVTHDSSFEEWANAPQQLDSGAPKQSLGKLRKTLRIEMLNEQGQPVHRYLVYRCWVSEFQALPDLDAGQNSVAIEHIKLENEGWEHDLSLTEPDQTSV